MEGGMNVKLPSRARAKLAAIERAADDSAALTNRTLASLKGVEAQVSTRLSALEHCEDDAARAEELKAELHALGENAARLREELSTRQVRQNADQSLVTQIGAWLDRMPVNVGLEVVEPPAREPGDESPRAAVERYRAQIKKLRVEMEKVRRAPLPPADIKRLVRAWVDQHATRGRPLIQVDGDKVDVVFERTASLVRGDRYTAPLSADTFVWLFRDELAAAMDREVEARAIVGGLTRDERAAQLETLRAQLLDLERAEESAIQRAKEEGTVIARRGDADPRAVLGVRFIGVAASRAA
jgi:hypothetical protein